MFPGKHPRNVNQYKSYEESLYFNQVIKKTQKRFRIRMGQLNCIFVVAKLPEHRRYHGRKRNPLLRAPLRRAKIGPEPTPIDYNIVDSDGFCLWVDTSGGCVLKDGAFDSADPSAEFQFHLYDPPETATVWIEPRAFTRVEAVAVDFMPNSPQIVMVTS